MNPVFSDEELLDIALRRSDAEDGGGSPPLDLDPCRDAKARVRAALRKSGSGSMRCASALAALAECMNAHYVCGRHHPCGAEGSAWLPLRPGERAR